MKNLDQLAQRIELVNRLSHSIIPENHARRELQDIIENIPHITDDEIFQIMFAVAVNVRRQGVNVPDKLLEGVILQMLADVRIKYPDHYRTKEFDRDLPEVFERITVLEGADPNVLLNAVNVHHLYPYMALHTIMDVVDLILLDLHASDFKSEDIKIIITNTVACAAKLHYHHEIEALLSKVTEEFGGRSYFDSAMVGSPVYPFN